MTVPGVLPGASVASPKARARGRADGAAAAAVVVPAASLGTTDEITVPPVVDALPAFDPVTGEVKDPPAARIRRFELQRAAAKVLPGHAVTQCLRRPLPDRSVGIRRREDARAYYQGLRTCGRVWACPVCASKVSERRRHELRQAVASHQSGGGSVLLATFTLPHQACDSPTGLLDRLLAAYLRLWSGRDRVRLPGLVGTVRALEVTHGANGWHPHLHVLFFVEAAAATVVPGGATGRPVGGSITLDACGLLGELHGRWQRLLPGVHPVHGVTVQDGSAAADYVSKWGKEPRWTIAEELTKANVKASRTAAGRAPFALLADFAGGDTLAGQLFRRYVEAFKGRSQLHWSRGLRARLALGAEKSDQVLAATVDATDELLGSFTDTDWALIARREVRGPILEAARLDGWPGVLAMLDLLRPPRLARSGSPPGCS